MTELAGPAGAADPAASTAASTVLTPEERAAAFTGNRPSVDRAAALAAGTTPVPRKVVVGIIIAFAVIGFGGLALEHYFGNVGVATSVTTTTLSTTGAPPPAIPTPPAVPQLNAPLDAFIGLKSIGPTAAPDLTLTDRSGARWSLQDQTGKVVVVTFLDTGCNDLCPVLGEELRQASLQLGPAAPHVEFAIVNTDPTRTSVVADPQALSITGLDANPSVQFLTGSLRQLDAIWAAYGVEVTVGQSATQVAHNNIIYFVDAQGRLRSEAVPFGNENQRGGYTLPAAEVTRFSEGIAHVAASLTTSP